MSLELVHVLHILRHIYVQVRQCPDPVRGPTRLVKPTAPSRSVRALKPVRDAVLCRGGPHVCERVQMPQISRWRQYPDVIARLPPFGECTDFSLASVLGPVWDFAADSDA